MMEKKLKSVQVDDDNYAADCKELLRIAPATLVYDMEHGSKFERMVIADMKKAAGDNNEDMRSPKRKVNEKSCEMSPRELARYAVVNMMDNHHRFALQPGDDVLKELVELDKSFYVDHIKELNKDDYIEYLEQLVKEVEHKWTKSYVEAAALSTKYLLTLEEYCLKIDRDIHRNEEKKKHEKTLEHAKDIYWEMEDDFTNSKYITSSLGEVLTKGYWEKKE